MLKNKDAVLNLKLQWSTTMKVVLRENRVVLINEETGDWTKISLECYTLICEEVENKKTVQEFLDSFCEKDREYISNLIFELYRIELFKFMETEEILNVKQVYYMITERCNLRCVHCSVDADKVNDCEVLSTSEVIENFDIIMKKMQPKRIILTGGEPMLRDDFFELLTYLHNNFSEKLALLTNGTLIDENNVDILISCLDSIDMSIDGIDEESCSKIRGKGVFNKVIFSVKLLQSKGFKNISLSMVFGNLNSKLMKEFYKLNEELGTKPVPRVFAKLGRGKNAEVLYNGTRENVDMNNLDTFDKERMSIQVNRNNLRASTCSACKNEICINSKGDIYPCVLLLDKRFCLGNIKDLTKYTDFFGIKDFKNYNGYKEYGKLLPDNIEKCKDCDLRYFCWSCVAFEEMYLRGEQFEARCRSKKEALNTLIWKEW